MASKKTSQSLLTGMAQINANILMAEVKKINKIIKSSAQGLIKETKSNIIHDFGKAAGQSLRRRNSRYWPNGHRGSNWSDPNYKTYRYLSINKLTDAVVFRGIKRNYKGQQWSDAVIHILGKGQKGDGSYIMKWLEPGIQDERKTRKGYSRGIMRSAKSSKPGKGWWPFWRARMDKLPEFQATAIRELSKPGVITKIYHI